MRTRCIALVASATACGRFGFSGSIDAGVGEDVSPDSSGPDCVSAPSCPSFALLCDSFEGPTIDAATWSQALQSGTVAVDTSRSCRGASSMHASVAAIASGSGVAAIGSIGLPFAPTTLFMRAYMFLPSGSAPDTSTQACNFLQASQNTGNTYGIQVADRSGNIRVTNFEATEVSLTTTQPWPNDRWICVEWEIDFPSSDGVFDASTRVWVDDVPVPTLDPYGGLDLPPSTQPINYLEFGTAIYGSVVPLPATELWIDDIVVANQRIGCSG